MVIRLKIVEGRSQFSKLLQAHRIASSQIKKIKAVTRNDKVIIGKDHSKETKISSFPKNQYVQPAFLEQIIKSGQEVDLSPYQKPERQEIHQKTREEIDRFVGELPLRECRKGKKMSK